MPLPGVGSPSDDDRPEAEAIRRMLGAERPASVCAGLSVEWTGEHKNIRRLYCSTCKPRFTERQGTLMRYTKLPEATVVRIVK